MKLSNPQLNALTLLVMAGKHGASAYKLGVGNTTLNALVKRRLVDYNPKLGDEFFPRQRHYVVTELGYKTHKEKMERR